MYGVIGGNNSVTISPFPFP